MPLFTARVLANQEVAHDYYQLDFSWISDAPRPVPGQFLTVRVGSSGVPLLRRPFAFSDAAGERASMIYWRRGDATRAIAGYQPGDAIDVMGPLGVAFPEPTDGAVPVLIAGGVGVGPILFLANALAARAPYPILLIGARSAQGLPRVRVDGRVQLRTATDDGSAGYAGTVIDLLDRTLDITAGDVELYLCGPNPMLRAGHDLAARHGIPAWVSMEQTMGCAVGACMGCAIHLTGVERYARVCTEGPVFRSTDVDWERL